jgi:hypothetical protein
LQRSDYTIKLPLSKTELIELKDIDKNFIDRSMNLEDLLFTEKTRIYEKDDE